MMRLPAGAIRGATISRASRGPTGSALVRGGLVVLASCGPPTGPPAGLAPPEGSYILDVTGDSALADLAVSLDFIFRDGDLGDSVVQGAWQRLDTAGTDGGPLQGTWSGGVLTLRWTVGDTLEVTFRGAPTDTNITGNVAVRGVSSPAQLFVLGSLLHRPPWPALTGWFDPGPAAVVVLRSDDSRDADRDFVNALAARQLYADFAVITQRLERTGFLTWREVLKLQREGHAIVAHSRRHQAGELSVGMFAWEALGSRADLEQRGLAVRAFVVPGLWTGESYLDSVQKATGVRGRILRHAYSSADGWVYSVPRTLPIPDSVRFGVGHVTVDHIAMSAFMSLLRQTITVQGYLTVLSHPYQADWGILQAVLDTLAAYADQGVIVLASGPVALWAGRDGAPNLTAAGGGRLSSANAWFVEKAPGDCVDASVTLDADSIALVPGCVLRVRLARPPAGVAAGLAIWWTASRAGDSIVLGLSVDAAARHGTTRRCEGGGLGPARCEVRLGVVAGVDTVYGSIRSMSLEGDTVWLRGASLGIR